MRHLVGSAALALIASVVVACGSHGGGSSDATAENPATEAPAAPIAGDPAATPASAPPPGDAPPPAAAAADGGVPEGGGGAGDGGGGGPAVANPECLAGSIHETEANDTEATANPIPNTGGSLCGSLATAGDVDFVSFVLPAGTKGLNFGLSYSEGGLQVDGTAGGVAWHLGDTPPFKPGQKYVLKVHTTGNTPVDYLLSVDIKQ